MARKEKSGLDYYSVDTDIFRNRKIRKLLRAFSAKGYLIYAYILTEIYRDKGYFIEWDKDTAFDVSDFLNVDENLVIEVVNLCCSVGLFNKELRANEGVLTTENIQDFWQKVSKGAKRVNSKVDPRLRIEKHTGTVKAEESTLKREESTLKAEETTVNREESTQSKVKESKGNKSKEEKGKKKSQVFSPPSLEEFKNYAIEKSQEKNLNLDLTKAELKYEAWKVANWTTGKGTKIKNWRSTLLNTLVYLQKEKSSEKKEKVAVGDSFEETLQEYSERMQFGKNESG